MKVIKNLIEERKWKKKYNSLKVAYDTMLVEFANQTDEIDFLQKQVRKLTKERAMLRGRNTKQKLPNDKGSTNDSRNRVSISKQDN
jgi:hypothetical protein